MTAELIYKIKLKNKLLDAEEEIRHLNFSMQEIIPAQIIELQGRIEFLKKSIKEIENDK